MLRNDIVDHSSILHSRIIGPETLHDQSEKRKQPYDAHQNQNDVCDGVSDQPVSFHGS